MRWSKFLFAACSKVASILAMEVQAFGRIVLLYTRYNRSIGQELDRVLRVLPCRG